MSQPPAPAQLDPSLGHVCFDFGTTASTATMFAGLQGASRPMDPEHVKIVRRLLIELIELPWPDEQLRSAFAAAARNRTRLKEKAAADMHQNIGPEWGAANGVGQPETELEQLARWLRGESPDGETPAGSAWQDLMERPRTVVLDEVWMALVEFLRVHAELQDWGNLRLHTILHQALRQPAFAQSNLVSIPLEGKITKQVDSILVVPGVDIDRAELTDRPPDSGELSFRGLKRRLPKPVPLPAALAQPGKDSDVLVGRAYQFLAGKVTSYAAAELNASGYSLATVIVTYPTTSPPAVRQRLHDLVKRELGVKRVLMRFDEGVAALMFVLMRDFGGDDESGIEAFRAKSRLVGAGHWRQNLLVVDIGGGTTDIALTRLDLRNATPAADREAEGLLSSGADGAVAGGPRTRGRVYFLEPQVLGSTGHQQCGGDLLTLRVLYWIKARVADAVREAVAGHEDEDEILHGWPASAGAPRPSLARALIDHQDPGPGPRDVVSYLRDVLPTRNATRPPSGEPYSQQLEPAFLQLWQIALNAKVSLAERVPYTLTGPDLTKIAGQLTGAWRAELDGLIAGGTSLQFTVEDFDALAEAVLTPAISLAVDLARRLLPDQPDQRGEPGELLDGIALTGRAAGIPLVRELLLTRLAEVFGERNRKGRPMSWNPALVTAEHDHPKAAASIGACWAEAKNQDAQKSLKAIAESPHLKAGHDQLIINVDNMVVNLPCRFGLGRAGNQPLVLLRHGEPLDKSDVRGRRFARSEWLPANSNIRLLRYLDQLTFVQWGHYNIEERLQIELPEELRFQIQIDDELVPTLHLCMGRMQRYGLEGSGLPLDARLPRGSLKGGLLTSLPWDICVRNVDKITGEASWQVVIEAALTITGTSFPFDFVPLDAGRSSSAAPIVPGKISRRLPPPVLADNGAYATGQLEYVFAAIVPGETEPLWQETVPATRRNTAGDPWSDLQAVPHWAVLDAFGVLHLPEPGYPRYQPAIDVRMMLGEPGSVFSTPMEPPQPDMRSDWDPFTGEH